MVASSSECVSKAWSVTNGEREGHLNRAGAADETLLTMAHEQARIFVTRDRDFGGLVFVRGFGAGVIYLRLEPSTLQAVHEELARVLQSYAEEALHNAFVVVEPGRHRFRRLSP
jgi:predicted nuclease of predicted toxin-antitoxin system